MTNQVNQAFEKWFESQYNHKPKENNGVYMTMFADGASKATKPPPKPAIPEGWKLVPIESDEKMKDGARAFLAGLELGTKTFENMSEHLRLSGAYLPDWFLTSKGHINKMAKAHYIYESMLNASPTNTGVGNENILLSL